jgi:hypothetical protein
MHRSGVYNKEFCDALVGNLQFIAPDARTLAFGNTTQVIRTTILYDARPDDVLRAIPRPAQLPASDCAELVPNHDFDGVIRLLGRLGVSLRSGGPWMVVVDPWMQRAIIFHFKDKWEQFPAWVDRVTYALLDPQRWTRRRGISAKGILERFSADGLRADVVPLPADFPR